MRDVDLIALAGLLHDIGKFGQRAEIPLRKPFNSKNYGYKHSAYTAQILQDYFNDIQNYHQYAYEHHIVDQNSDENSWIVAVADRMASGFEREIFEKYNKSYEFEDFKKQRLRGLFDESKEYAIDKLSPKSIFYAEEKSQENEYKRLWESFTKDLEKLRGTNGNQTTDLIGLEYLLKKYMTFIPSATSFINKEFPVTKANIPLYDHIKTTAIFASAISKLDTDKKENLINYYRKTEPYKEENGFILINGDFFGIQDFIFNEVEAKAAAKVLRGKSAYVQILTKTIAFYVIERLGLSRLSIINDSAGKFEILAPNSKNIKDELQNIQSKLNDFFVKEFFGQTGVGISFVECGLYDFIEKGRYQNRLRKDLAIEVEKTKLKKFDLFEKDYDLNWDENLNNENQCFICKHRIGDEDKILEKRVCQSCKRFIDIGKELARKKYLVITKDKTTIHIFNGYYLKFIDNNPKGLDKTVAIYDISKDEEFSGFAKWEISSYVAQKKNLGEKELHYLSSKNGELSDILTFEDLAKLSVKEGIINNKREFGVEALMALKGDVDNMGRFIRNSDVTSSFAKYNFFSRIVDYFFSVYVPYLMNKEYQYTYTVFAGGDDLFVLGAWDEVLDLSAKVREEFMKFSKGSPLSFSIGLSMTKPNKPVKFIANIAEEFLENSKDVEGKDALSIFYESVKWDDYLDDLGLYDTLKEMEKSLKGGIPTTFLYRLLEFCDMSKRAKNGDIKSTIWKSKLNYSYKRNLENELSKELEKDFLSTIDQMIEKYPSETKIVLSKFVYKHRRS